MLLHHCRKDLGLSQVPFIVYTATYTEPQDEHLAMNLGADAFVVKPCEPTIFMTLVDEVLCRDLSSESSLDLNSFRDDTTLLKKYNEVLIRKLEKKAMQLEETNRGLLGENSARRIAQAFSARLASIVESSEDAIYSQDLEGLITTWNSGAEKVFGYKSSEILGRSGIELIPQDRLEEESQLIMKVLKGGKVKHFETIRKTKESKLINISISISPILDPSGKIFGASRVAHEITERIKSEEMLHASQQRLSFATKSAKIGIWEWELSSNKLIWDDQMYELYGIRQEEFSGAYDAWEKGLHPEDRARSESELAAAVAEVKSFNSEFRIVWPNGEVRVIEANAMPQCHADGSVERVIGVNRDVTERSKLEQKYYHAQKMEAIGVLAGGIAHDFNNIMTIINGYSDILLLDFYDHPKLGIIEEIRSAGERAVDLTRQLLAVSRKQVTSLESLDLSDVVNNTVKMLRAAIGEGVKLVLEIDPNACTIKADLGQIEQILLNLSINARDSMPQGGTFVIQTSIVEADEAYLQNHPTIIPGVYVTLKATDTGSGMSETVKQHLFEAFFTTKDIGKGSGLGLAVVEGIVKQSEGFIEVESELGSGSSFTIYFPYQNKRALNKKAVFGATKTLARYNEVVLLAEDEEAVRELASLIMREQGYTVLEARNGEEALIIAKAYSQSIDLLVTDVVMPGINGRMLSEQLSQLCPKIKVLYISGYTDDSIMRNGILHDEVTFLPKPFSPTALALKIREALAR